MKTYVRPSAARARARRWRARRRASRRRRRRPAGRRRGRRRPARSARSWTRSSRSRCSQSSGQRLGRATGGARAASRRGAVAGAARRRPPTRPRRPPAIAVGRLPVVIRPQRSAARSGSIARDACRPRRRPPTRAVARRHRGRVAADARRVHDTAFVAGSIRDRVPSCAVDDPHRALADRHRARPVADRDRAHDGARARLDPGHRPGLLARHPERPGSGGDRGRVRADGDRSVVARPRARSMRWTAPSTPDATHSAPPATASARGALPDLESLRTTRFAPGSICATHAAVAVRDPQRAGPERERRRAPADRDRDDLVAARGRSARRCRRAALATHTEPPPATIAPGRGRPSTAP